MTSISHLVVNGCSFTYGEGLDDPKTQSWSALLAKNIGVPIVNLARNGTGNDAIHRRTYEYFYEDIKNNNNPFYVICFSNITRKEYWFSEQNRYDGIHIHNIKYGDMNSAQKNHVENYNIEDLYRQTMIYKSSLRNLFKAHSIPYVFFTLMHMGDEQNDIEKQLCEKFPQHLDTLINDDNDLGSQYEILKNNYKTLPCGHYDIDTNKTIADYLTTKIKQKHTFNLVQSDSYLSLIDFTKLIEPYYDHPEQDPVFGKWK